MRGLGLSGPKKGEKGREDSLAHVRDEALEVFGDLYIPLLSGSADGYLRGSSNLHIHCAFGEVQLCVVLHHPPIARVVPSSGTAVWQVPTARGRSQTDRHYRQVGVAVFVGETIEGFEEIDFEVGVAPVLGRLQFLEDCDSSRLHFSGTGVPPLASLRSLLIVPFDTVLPNSLPENWKADVSTHFWWVESNGEVIEAGADVIDEIGGNHLGPCVDLTGEVQSVDVLLALSPFGDRVRVAVDVVGAEPFELILNRPGFDAAFFL